ncbi:hypothetical protein GGR50DRAFT_692781 [Xylaria sp. CBS 124048]|nr:hypothetical protein GGR50DRAFT_692781 [Xylaria sp. CBS 124048]
MYFTTILALCLVALATAAPTAPHTNSCKTADEATNGRVTFTMTKPDCPSLLQYCTHCDEDFNCETDPRCEWCYEHGGFDDSP